MGVYDTATKLANEIKISREYKEFKKNMNNVKKDKDAERILTEYKFVQLEIQKYLIENRSIDKKSKLKMEEIQNTIRKNTKLEQYLISEKRFTSMMDNINKILAKSIEKDYK